MKYVVGVLIVVVLGLAYYVYDLSKTQVEYEIVKNEQQKIIDLMDKKLLELDTISAHNLELQLQNENLIKGVDKKLQANKAALNKIKELQTKLNNQLDSVAPIKNMSNEQLENYLNSIY